MKVILIQDVESLGKIGDNVNVKAGYARNFLIPNKLALFATAENLKSIDSGQFPVQDEIFHHDRNFRKN